MTDALTPRELEALRDRVEELEGVLGIGGLTPLEWTCRPRGRTWKLLNFLAKRGNARTEAIWAAVWGDSIDERADIGIVPVAVCALRKGLKPHGIEVRCIWGEGYGFTPDMRAKAQALIEKLRAGDIDGATQENQRDA